MVRGRRWCRSVSVVVGGGERRGSNAGSCHLISMVDASRLLRWPSTRAQLKGLEIKKEISWEIKEAWMEEAAALRGRR
ncbi:hypothetical protein HID58_021639 [Brassica napus]|uniref:Uncharacterized protein n=1 Tax=Brassica napus TaxID=3708 RepID=A0ABQ8CZB6_BRANA|nr:hypothetical protein HID58_021638 [Brassica napus]KAH0921621.1 hypothetical protein HID58_021639 [Brassica napus]